MQNQLNKGQQKRLIYIEYKSGEIEGHKARVGWVTFSKSGKSIYYRNLMFSPIKGGGISGNYFCETLEGEFWISGIKKRGSNAHWAEYANIHIDTDAVEAYNEIKAS